MLTIDQIYRYRSLAGQRQGYCRLRIYKQRNGSQTVLLTEVSNNPGQSITAASDVIATSLVKRYQLDPTTTHWIEHWPAEPSPEHAAALTETHLHEPIAADPVAGSVR
jgi:hypothetical protein